MKESKSPILHLKNSTFSFIFLVSCIVGGFVAHKIFEQYPIVARAILGAATLFFVWLEFLSSWKSIDETPEIQLEIPKDLRYFIYGLVLAAISVWASIQILDLARYLLYGYVSR